MVAVGPNLPPPASQPALGVIPSNCMQESSSVLGYLRVTPLPNSEGKVAKIRNYRANKK